MTNTRITIKMIEDKEFKTKSRGYDPQEVDEFLDAICDEMEQLYREQAELQKKLAEQPATDEEPTKTVQPVQQSVYAAPVHTEAAPENTFREILELAQRVKDETISNAKKQAAEILANANSKASEQLGDLNDQKEALTRQVEDLRAAAADYRARFESLLNAQQEALKQAADLF